MKTTYRVVCALCVIQQQSQPLPEAMSVIRTMTSFRFHRHLPQFVVAVETYQILVKFGTFTQDFSLKKILLSEVKLCVSSSLPCQ